MSEPPYTVSSTPSVEGDLEANANVPEHGASTLTPSDDKRSPRESPCEKEENASTRRFTEMLQQIRAPTATKAPKETLKAVYAAGKYKAALTLRVLLVQSFMAGLYIAMAGHLYLTVGGGILGASLFPTGLIAVLLTSGELFTGDALIFVASVLGGQVSVKRLVRNWTVSWIGNFIGALVWAVLIAFLSGALEDAGKADFAIQVALKKAHQPWGHIFLKGIGANLMVCLGVWQFVCAEEAAGKILALWFPVTGFVAAGLDHCIANQFLIPIGMMLLTKQDNPTDSISVYELFIEALLPATLGNLVGGGLFIGAVYWYVFDELHAAYQARESITKGVNRKHHHGLTPDNSTHPPGFLERVRRRHPTSEQPAWTSVDV